jgi:hypothetical protein
MGMGFKVFAVVMILMMRFEVKPPRGVAGTSQSVGKLAVSYQSTQRLNPKENNQKRHGWFSSY